MKIILSQEELSNGLHLAEFIEVINSEIFYTNDFIGIKQRPITKKEAIEQFKKYASDLDTMELLNFMEDL